MGAVAECYGHVNWPGASDGAVRGGGRPFHRVEVAGAGAERLCAPRCKVINYGEDDHPEARGVIAWTQGPGIAILEPEEEIEIPRRKVAVLSQITKSEESFAGFVAGSAARNTGRFDERRISDRTCPETHERSHDREVVARREQLDGA